jgi:hypothetical protein
MKSLILIFLLFSFSYAAWEELVTLTCNGQLNFLSKNAVTFFGFDLSTIAKVEGFIIDQFKEKVKCKCPNLSDSDFRKYFLYFTPEFIFNMFAQTKDLEPSSCDFDGKFQQMLNLSNGVPEFVFPTTCNSGTWDSKGNCLLVADWSSTFQMKIGFAMAKCSNSYLPYVSIVCDGAGCSNIAKPCNDNAHCGAGLKCVPITTSEDGVTKVNKPEDKDIFNLTATLLLYGPENPSPGCYAPTNIMTNIYDFILKEVFDGTKTTPPRTYAQFCIPEALSPDENFINSLNTSAKLDSCKIETADGGMSCDYVDCQKEDCYNSSCFNSTSGQLENCIECKNITTTCEQCSSYTRVTKIDCTSSLIKDWDGKSGTTDVLSAGRLDGSAFTKVASTVAPVGDDSQVFGILDCAGNFQMFPNGNYHLAAGAGAIPRLSKLFMDNVRSIQNCRTVGLEDQIFKIMYGLEGVMYYLTTPTPSLVVPNKESWSIHLKDMSRVVMPETCTLDYFQKNGYCAVRYSGMQSLIGLDMTFSARISQCTNSPLFEVYIGCKGNDCFFGNKFKFCSTNADCTETTKCSNIFDFSIYNDDPTNPPPTNVQDEYIDMTMAYPIYYYGLLTNDTCWASKAGDVMRLGRDTLRYMEGLPKDTSTNLDTFICFADVDYIKKQNFTQWAMDQVKIDGTTITLKDLKAWTAPKPGPTPGGLGDNTDTNFSIRVMFSLLLVVFLMFI